MRIVLIGCGTTAQTIIHTAEASGHVVMAIVRKQALPFGDIPTFSSIEAAPYEAADVVIDFSRSDHIVSRVEVVMKAKKPLIIGTTGWANHEPDVRAVVDRYQGTCIASPNFSMGVQLFKEVVRYATVLFSHLSEYEFALSEIHHSKKQDSPSGTALLLREAAQHSVERPIPIASLRVGAVPGTHTFYIDSSADTIELTHTARTRVGFAQGALFAAQWAMSKRGYYTMDDIVQEILSEKQGGL